MTFDEAKQFLLLKALRGQLSPHKDPPLKDFKADETLCCRIPTRNSPSKAMGVMMFLGRDFKPYIWKWDRMLVYNSVPFLVDEPDDWILESHQWYEDIWFLYQPPGVVSIWYQRNGYYEGHVNYDEGVLSNA
jgi:hypothetical protein